MTVITVFYIVICIVLAFIVVLDRRPAETTLSWLLIISLVPIVGVITFIIFGINWQRIRLMRRLPEDVFEQYLADRLMQQRLYIKEAFVQNMESGNDIIKNIYLLNSSNHALLTTQNSFQLYYNGKVFFEEMLHELNNAQQSIYMEFFIWRSDTIGNKIKDVLIRKAEQGISVKLLFDSFGSFGRISYKYRRELKKAGIEFKYFLDLLRPIAGITRFNYRNHRKLIVIDGVIGYVGGMNVGNEYIDGGKRFKYWRDTQLRIEGDASKMLESVFLTDWHNSGNTLIIDNDFFPEFDIDMNGIPIQIGVSGPDSTWNSIKLTLCNMFTNANHSIYIQSPYLVLDQGTLEVLQLAALSGVDVQIMMTGIPDKKIPFWAAETYIDDLIKAGVKIYQYKEGFFHSKVIVVDQQLCTVGTSNMDIRSFRLNYEINAVVYSRKMSMELISQYNIDKESCILLSMEDVKKRTFLQFLRSSICRLLSPIM